MNAETKGMVRAKPTRGQTPAQAALEAAQAEEHAAMEAVARAKAARERARQMALEAEEEELRAERALREQQQAIGGGRPLPSSSILAESSTPSVAAHAASFRSAH
jgi:hypothetical protein